MPSTRQALFSDSAEDLAASEATFVLLLSVLDENAAQELRARRSYTPA